MLVMEPGGIGSRQIPLSGSSQSYRVWPCHLLNHWIVFCGPDMSSILDFGHLNDFRGTSLYDYAIAICVEA